MMDRNDLWHLAIGVCLLFFCKSAFAVDLVISSKNKSLSQLRTIASQWEEETSNRIIWLDKSKAVADITADIAIVSLSESVNLANSGLTLPLTLNDELLPKYLSNSLLNNSEDSWLGMPVSVEIPRLFFNPTMLRRAGVSIPNNPSWPDVFSMASSMSDPLGEVHGFCVASQQHATMIRSLIIDADKDWLDKASNLPYSGTAWLDHTAYYAQQLASIGPSNAASLVDHEFRDLLNQQRCAIWLSNSKYELKRSIFVPGAAAFASINMQVAVVFVESAQTVVAADFVRWISSEIFKNADKLNQLGSKEKVRIGLQLIGWQEADKVAQDDLRLYIDGLISLDEALDKSATNLKSLSSN